MARVDALLAGMLAVGWLVVLKKGRFTSRRRIVGGGLVLLGAILIHRGIGRGIAKCVRLVSRC